MGSTWGKNVKISIFGESHGASIGVVIDGLPSGYKIDFNLIDEQMKRRAPGNKKHSTNRVEADEYKIQSGILNDKTTGAPLCAIIENTNTRSQDYTKMRNIPRPGHSDFPANARYSGSQDTSGGGHFSGRLTAPLVFAGAVCTQILAQHGVQIAARVRDIAGVHDASEPTFEQIKACANKEVPAVDDQIAELMLQEIVQAKENLDSVGGIVECVIDGVKCGYGNPMFDNVESVISSILFGIPAVKGVEFGKGFESASSVGSINNDEYFVDENDQVKTYTNNSGGILGGITTGMPIVVRAAFKPTPSIYKSQKSVDLETLEQVDLEIKGRHDPCVVIRAVPVVESVCAIAILDIIMSTPSINL